MPTPLANRTPLAATPAATPPMVAVVVVSSSTITTTHIIPITLITLSRRFQIRCSSSSSSTQWCTNRTMFNSSSSRNRMPTMELSITTRPRNLQLLQLSPPPPTTTMEEEEVVVVMDTITTISSSTTFTVTSRRRRGTAGATAEECNRWGWWGWSFPPAAAKLLNFELGRLFFFFFSKHTASFSSFHAKTQTTERSTTAFVYASISHKHNFFSTSFYLNCDLDTDKQARLRPLQRWYNYIISVVQLPNTFRSFSLFFVFTHWHSDRPKYTQTHTHTHLFVSNSEQLLLMMIMLRWSVCPTETETPHIAIFVLLFMIFITADMIWYNSSMVLLPPSLSAPQAPLLYDYLWRKLKKLRS